MTQLQGATALLGRLAILAMLLLATNGHADTPISLPLTGAAEVPKVNTAATGMVKLSVHSNRIVSGGIETSGMQPTMAHIHEAAAGKNGPPIITLIKKGESSFTVPADAKFNEAQYASYLAGNLYVNVHSEAYPNGEIRAQLPGKPMRVAN
jgi:hypothetical protein